MKTNHEFTPGERLISKAAGSRLVEELKSSVDQGDSPLCAPFISLNFRLSKEARDPQFLESLERLKVAEELPPFKRIIERAIRLNKPTDLERQADQHSNKLGADLANFIKDSIQKGISRNLEVPFSDQCTIRFSDDRKRAVYEIQEHRTTTRLCLLVSNPDAQDLSNTHLVIQSSDRYLYAMYPGAVRANLLLAGSIT